MVKRYKLVKDAGDNVAYSEYESLRQILVECEIFVSNSGSSSAGGVRSGELLMKIRAVIGDV